MQFGVQDCNFFEFSFLAKLTFRVNSNGFRRKISFLISFSCILSTRPVFFPGRIFPTEFAPGQIPPPGNGFPLVVFIVYFRYLFQYAGQVGIRLSKFLSAAISANDQLLRGGRGPEIKIPLFPLCPANQIAPLLSVDRHRLGKAQIFTSLTTSI